MLRKRSAPILAAADRGLEPGTSDPTPLPLQNQTSQAEEGASGPEGASFPTDHPGEFFWERAERGLPELRLQPTAKLLPRERVQGSLALHPPHPFPAVFQELKSPERLRAVRATAPGESGRAVPGGGAVTQRLGARTTNCDEEPASSEKRACVVQLRRRGPEADS
ncbi:uncharacterized protein [Notamacropus eugenii]|uniref:uncharacterized protein isoform X3 n=1 Tax=Notamacropus eugenii TaxID=9315 RepID=UPI003B67C8D6